MLLLQMHTCCIFPSKCWSFLFNEVKPVTLEQLPKPPDLFEMQLLLKIRILSLCKIHLLKLFKGMSGTKIEMPLGFRTQDSL